jgi:hypothetical protein
LFIVQHVAAAHAAVKCYCQISGASGDIRDKTMYIYGSCSCKMLLPASHTTDTMSVIRNVLLPEVLYSVAVVFENCVAD